MKRALLSLCLVLGMAIPGSLARSQQDEEETEGPQPSLDNPAYDETQCLEPEELLVVELVRSRHRELDQREELLVLREQALMVHKTEVRKEIEHLEALRLEIESLLQRRAEARAEGTAALVQMVNQMKPKDAAKMLELMETDVVVTVLEDLQPRQAGRILGAMPPAVAAELGSNLAIDPIAMDEEGDAS